MDARFEKLGAKRVVPLQKCDIDYDDEAEAWFEKVLAVLEEQPATEPAAIAAKPAAKKANGKKYYKGTILTNINLNDRGIKQTNLSYRDRYR